MSSYISQEVRKELIYLLMELRVSKALHTHTMIVHPTLFRWVGSLSMDTDVRAGGVLRIPMGVFLIPQQDQGEGRELGVFEVMYPSYEGDWVVHHLSLPIPAKPPTAKF